MNPPAKAQLFTAAQIEDARKLRSVISLALSRESCTFISDGEFWEGLRLDYKRTFGADISESRIRELFQRTKERDAGQNRYDRLHLYLPERPKTAAASSVNQGEAEPDSFANLRDLIKAIGPTPNADEKEDIWDEACAVIDEVVETGSTVNEARRLMVSLLASTAAVLVSWDCDNVTEAIRVSLHRKYQRWTSGGRNKAAVTDGRRRRSGKPPVEFNGEEWSYLQMLAAQYNNTDLALREFLLSDKVQADTKSYFRWEPSLRRLRAPQWLREKLDPMKATQQKFIRGPRTARLKGPHYDRDPASLASGDSDQSDDKTLELPWWDDTPEGIWFGQGQLLVWTDEASWLIHSFRLIADGAYSGFSIRNSWTDKARQWGLPRKRIHVEMGTWRSSAVFKGKVPSSNRWESVGTEETEQGLRRLGIRFRHATLPRGKLIERVFGSLADITMMLPGYAGRNQSIDRYEEVQRKIRLVKSGQEHPRDLGFLHRSQLVEHLTELANKLNGTVKYGKYHTKYTNGTRIYLSPREAYEDKFTTPLVFIPPQLEHIYRDNQILKKVGPNGILLTYGKRSYRYKNSAELGSLEGREAVIWFNPEDPSAISVMRPNGIESFAVPLSPQLSHDATPDEMAEASRASSAFSSYQREISRTLKPVFRDEIQKRLFRYPVVDSTAVDMGRQIEERREAVRASEKKAESTARAVREASKNVGLVPSIDAMRNPDSVRALKELGEFLNDSEGENK